MVPFTRSGFQDGFKKCRRRGRRGERPSALIDALEVIALGKRPRTGRLQPRPRRVPSTVERETNERPEARVHGVLVARVHYRRNMIIASSDERAGSKPFSGTASAGAGFRG